MKDIDPLRLEIEDDSSDGSATGSVFLTPEGGIDYIQMTAFW